MSRGNTRHFVLEEEGVKMEELRESQISRSTAGPINVTVGNGGGVGLDGLSEELNGNAVQLDLEDGELSSHAGASPGYPRESSSIATE